VDGRSWMGDRGWWRRFSNFNYDRWGWEGSELAYAKLDAKCPIYNIGALPLVV
jgi:hypothetical protein